jgi:hypothetical protein
MERSGKLKTDDWKIILFTLLLIVLLICAESFFGHEMFYYVLCVMPALAALAHFVGFLRTRNWGFLILMFFYVCVFLVFFPPLNSFSSYRSLRIIFAVCAGSMFILHIYVLATKRINWRYREVLELAAKPVDELADGFTSRPFPAGRAGYTKEEILGFSDFLIKNVIAYPFIEEDRVVLVVPENMFTYMLLLKRGYKKDTYVAFDFRGNVSVHIAKKDYQKYVEEFTFDRLCSSLGNLFIGFLDLYKKGNGEKIIKTLNAI